ncbi:hypothetical protein [Kytococcus sedentarius]|uniref:hypothetical protein n=1 Tax=Kytococcus sedentarius TaxID=1276 RepID=UPI0035BBDFC3
MQGSATSHTWWVLGLVLLLAGPAIISFTEWQSRGVLGWLCVLVGAACVIAHGIRSRRR